MQDKNRDGEKEDKRPSLNKGLHLKGSKDTFIVQELLGEGGCGAVYKVTQSRASNKIYAMKCEVKHDPRRGSKLTLEMKILRIFGGRKHFAELIDVGENKQIRFMVMELLGSNLSDLKKSLPSSMFSLSTALRVSQQCLDACRDLHIAGYIHRDVKPANFAVGRNSKRHIIHMLDFGISRRYGVGLGESTKATQFKGTLPYASVACHRFEELGPRDDCESWMYMLVDFLSPAGLPWKRATDHETVLQMKEEVREGKQAMFLCGVKCKKHLLKIITYIDGLKCSDRVDYSFIFNIIAEAAKKCKCNLQAPFDWEPEAKTHYYSGLSKRSPKRATAQSSVISHSILSPDVTEEDSPANVCGAQPT